MTVDRVLAWLLGLVGGIAFCWAAWSPPRHECPEHAAGRAAMYATEQRVDELEFRLGQADGRLAADLDLAEWRLDQGAARLRAAAEERGRTLRDLRCLVAALGSRAWLLSSQWPATGAPFSGERCRREYGKDRYRF